MSLINRAAARRQRRRYDRTLVLTGPGGLRYVTTLPPGFRPNGSPPDRSVVVPLPWTGSWVVS